MRFRVVVLFVLAVVLSSCGKAESDASIETVKEPPVPQAAKESLYGMSFTIKEDWRVVPVVEYGEEVTVTETGDEYHASFMVELAGDETVADVLVSTVKPFGLRYSSAETYFNDNFNTSEIVYGDYYSNKLKSTSTAKVGDIEYFHAAYEMSFETADGMSDRNYDVYITDGKNDGEFLMLEFQYDEGNAEGERFMTDFLKGIVPMK